jgi:GNAT superfamily N-acetyltransferase
MTIHVDVFPRGHGNRPESEDSKIAAWHRELFAPDRKIIDAFTWQDKKAMGFCLHAYRGGELAGFAHVFARLGRLDGAAVLMGCLGTVMTATAHQGTGVGSTTVKKANEIIHRSLPADLGVLLCKTSLVPFYERLGWRRMVNPVLVEQPAGKLRWPYAAMLLFGEDGVRLPEELDLCGLPF